MTNKFDVMHKEFPLLPKDMRAFKNFINSVPDVAAYKISTTNDNVFFDVYWIDVNQDNEPEPEPMPMYEINMPLECVYGKQAYELVTNLKPADGIPFKLNAFETINLSYGFVDILIHKIKNCQAPYILLEGWVKEHIKLLEQATEKYHVVVRFVEASHLV